MKKDAFYFPHDSNAHNDPKVISLRMKHGLEGYGFFWMMIELLRESKDYKCPSDPAFLEISLSLPQATLQALLETCIKVDLLQQNDGFVSSKTFTQRMKLVDRRREALRQAGRRGYEKKASLSTGLNKSTHPGQSQATLQATLEANAKPSLSSKVKESKVKESIRAHASKPSLEEVKKYCIERNNNVDAEKWFNYYTSNGWKVGKNPMKDWQAAVRTWEKSEYSNGNKKDEEFVI